VRGLRPFLLVGVLASLLAAVPAAHATHGAAGARPAAREINVWAGQWTITSKYGTGFALRALSVEAGFRAFAELGAERCDPPTTYYRGGYFDPRTNKAGKIVGCTEGAWSLRGRFLGDPNRDPGAKGSIEIEFKLPGRFEGFFTPDGTSSKYDYRGIRGKHFAEDGAFSPLVVNFSVRVSGKPNIEIKGAEPLTSAKVQTTQPSHATFTKYNADSPEVLEATETKGWIAADLVTASGKQRHYKFGIISQTGYSTQERRLALLLRTKESNDPSCPAGKSGAILYLLPTHAGVRDTAILFGIPYSKTVEIDVIFGVLKEQTQPCKGLAYGWENGDQGVRASTRLAETVPGAES
jgi:hypothetical protein